MTEPEFKKSVDQALKDLPPRVRGELKNIQILIQDRPGAEAGAVSRKAQLLGLYVGEPLTEQSAIEPPTFPSQIFIYRLPLLKKCGEDAEWLMEEIQLTVLHEVGHHLGMNDEEMEFMEPEEADPLDDQE